MEKRETMPIQEINPIMKCNLSIYYESINNSEKLTLKQKLWAVKHLKEVAI